jgi:hypothetical protein
MTGSNGSAAGVSGLVPAPSAGDSAKFLRGDGTWGIGATGAFSDVSASNTLRCEPPTTPGADVVKFTAPSNMSSAHALLHLAGLNSSYLTVNRGAQVSMSGAGYIWIGTEAADNFYLSAYGFVLKRATTELGRLAFSTTRGGSACLSLEGAAGRPFQVGVAHGIELGRVTTTVASAVPLTVKGASGQSADLAEWQNSSAAVLAALDASARLLINERLKWQKMSSVQLRDVARAEATMPVATDASRTGRLTVYASDHSAEREVMRLGANGTVATWGVFGAESPQQTGGEATASASYGATEQTMLQKVYDALRAFGLLT